MKVRRLVAAVVLVATVLLVGQGGAPRAVTGQGLQAVYLPLVRKEAEMSDWKIVVPEESTNYVPNPSFENNITDGWANYATGGAGGLRSQALTPSKWGAYSVLFQKNAGAAADRWGMNQLLDTSVLRTSYVASAWVYLGAGATACINITKAAGVGIMQAVQTCVTTPVGQWARIETPVLTANATGDIMRIYIWVQGTPVVNCHFDGVQVEHLDHVTTYIDGDQSGCWWNGAEHNSTSTRSGKSRAGGRVRDLQTDYGFQVGGMLGTGFPPLTMHSDDYAILPGGELNAIKAEGRIFTLTGVLQGTTLANLHAKKQALLDVLKRDAVPKDDDGWQPVRIRYAGAAVEKQIAAHYERGLETDIRAEMMCWERLAIRFFAPDPFWYEIGDSAVHLDSNDTDTYRIVAARLRATGQWDNLGPPAAPGTAVYNWVRTIARGLDGTLYFGGSFTDFNNIPAADNIVQYNPQTGAWSAVGAGLDNIVRDIVVAPDGQVYIGGSFTDVSGGIGGTYNRIVRWDPTTSTYNALGAGANNGVDNAVYALAVADNGDIFLGGMFLNAVGGAGMTRVGRWNGAAFAALGAGCDNIVRALDVDKLTGDLYAGGSFVNCGVVPVHYIARWDGAAWNALNVGLNNIVYAVKVASDRNVYAGGAFASEFGGGTVMDMIGYYNGAAWFALDNSIQGTVVYTIVEMPDGILIVSGALTGAVGLPGNDRVLIWNGSSWARTDIDLPGAPLVYDAIGINVDPVIGQNYDLYEGFNTTGGAAFAGDMAVANDGTVTAYPKIVISRNGGTSAILESIRNETTGKTLYCNYSLNDGESVTIDLTPEMKAITSNYWGAIPQVLLAGSDFGSFALKPGSNLITCFIAIVGATMENYVLWKDAYWSQD